MIKSNASTRPVTRQINRLLCACSVLLFSINSLSCPQGDDRYTSTPYTDSNVELHFINSTKVNISTNNNDKVTEANWLCQKDALVISHSKETHHFYFSGAKSQRHLGMAKTAPALISFCDTGSCPMRGFTFWLQEGNNLEKSSQPLNRLTTR